MKREQFIDILASAYYKFLTSLPFEQDMYTMLALKETTNKFLANLHIEIGKRELPKGKKDRRYGTDYISEKAEKFMEQGNIKDLRYEHLVPKSRYIIVLCEEKAKNNELTQEFVKQLLDKYYWTATVTIDEDKRLPRTWMPDNWDNKNVMARYEEVGIKLKRNEWSFIE